MSGTSLDDPDAILDRLVHNAHRTRQSGYIISYRLRHHPGNQCATSSDPQFDDKPIYHICSSILGFNLLVCRASGADLTFDAL